MTILKSPEAELSNLHTIVEFGGVSEQVQRAIPDGCRLRTRTQDLLFTDVYADSQLRWNTGNLAEAKLLQTSGCDNIE